MSYLPRWSARDRVKPRNLFSGLSECQHPPLPEQRTIAAFLDRETAKIDSLVAKKERLIKLLQEKRTALIGRAVTKGLDPDVPMKDSGVQWLGEIPSALGREAAEGTSLHFNRRIMYGIVLPGPPSVVRMASPS